MRLIQMLKYFFVAGFCNVIEHLLCHPLVRLELDSTLKKRYDNLLCICDKKNFWMHVIAYILHSVIIIEI